MATAAPLSTSPNANPGPGGGGLATIIILISIILIAPAIFLIGSTANKLDAGTISVPLGVALVLAGACCFILSLLGLTSIRIISPGETRVIQFFGRYIGTIRHTGLRAIPPLSNPTKVSIKVRNFETNTIKVNDLNGNPINIGAIVVWQVADTAKATFAVENVDDFIHSQAESALRHVATTTPTTPPTPPPSPHSLGPPTLFPPNLPKKSQPAPP